MEKEINTMLVEALEKIANNGFKTSDSDVYMVMASDCAKNALSQYSTLTGEAGKDPMALPEQYKTDDPIKAAVYFGWYHGLVNAHGHTFTWEQYQKSHPLSATAPADEIESSISEGEDDQETLWDEIFDQIVWDERESNYDVTQIEKSIQRKYHITRKQ